MQAEFEKAKSILDFCREKNLSDVELIELSCQLAAVILEISVGSMSKKEQLRIEQIAAMVKDDRAKKFFMHATDQCFRSSKSTRVSGQLLYLLKKWGIPSHLGKGQKFFLRLMQLFGARISSAFVPLIKKMIRKEMSYVMVSGEQRKLYDHLEKRERQGFLVNINRLGEAIVGESQAKQRLDLYLKDLEKPEVGCISVKISTLYSQINILGWDQTVEILQDRMRLLYRTAATHTFRDSTGKCLPKFINLDMEEWHDVEMTKQVFKTVLDEPEFHRLSAGIVLQAYLPESFLIQQELTAWAMRRVAGGGAPIRIRLVKGANLAMEKVYASLQGWEQTPYERKDLVDAHYKKMIDFAFQKERVQAVHIGIASHNLFDISYALIRRNQKNLHDYICFEMLQGMADHMSRVVQEFVGSVLLYTPAVKKEDVNNAIAYLVRRLDENTLPGNFLTDLFSLSINSAPWDQQMDSFTRAVCSRNSVSSKRKRVQNRSDKALSEDLQDPYKEDPPTDFVLVENREWLKKQVEECTFSDVGLMINGQLLCCADSLPSSLAKGSSPNAPFQTLYHYRLATEQEVDQAVIAAEKARLDWGKKTAFERVEIVHKAAAILQQNRGKLIALMMHDGAKSAFEADREVSEAIDFVYYYCRSACFWAKQSDLDQTPLGTVVVASPWNFPLAIPIGGVVAALIMGNTVIAKPSEKTPLVAWWAMKALWEAGVSKEVLQFIVCTDDPVGTHLVQSKGVDAVVITGATATAQKIIQCRPKRPIFAETGGKNSMIVTAMADKDLAVKDIIESAFHHSGQKCSACSLLILESEVYDDTHFLELLKDAAQSVQVGSSMDFSAIVTPLIQKPNVDLEKGLTRLEKGEKWLLEPVVSPHNPQLWSPGIRIGTDPKHKGFSTEYFGPVLSVVRAENLQDAINIANQTCYGLTAGLHSLDEREHLLWKEKIVAGNLYINRGITGAIVGRQPFGGCKKSSFGFGAKAGGPNYLLQFVHSKQIHLPLQGEVISERMQELAVWLSEERFTAEELVLWRSSIAHYQEIYQSYFAQEHHLRDLIGQQNNLLYRPFSQMGFRIQQKHSLLDIARVFFAAELLGTSLEVSGDWDVLEGLGVLPDYFSHHNYVAEGELVFAGRMKDLGIDRIRLLPHSAESIKEQLCLYQICSEKGMNIVDREVVANGRVELLCYLQEVSISQNIHRYGCLDE